MPPRRQRDGRLISLRKTLTAQSLAACGVQLPDDIFEKKMPPVASMMLADQQRMNKLKAVSRQWQVKGSIGSRTLDHSFP